MWDLGTEMDNEEQGRKMANCQSSIKKKVPLCGDKKPSAVMTQVYV